MTQPVIYLRDTNNKYRAIISLIPDWEGFEKLIKYLEVNYQAEILQSDDGPDVRRWIVEVNQKIIEVIHSDGYGNYFLAPTAESENLVKEIGEDLERRLKHIEE